MRTIPISSAAAMRRAAQTPGVVIHVIEHWQEQLRGTTRTVQKAQQNGYFFMAPATDGTTGRMWCAYPPAKELRFNENGSVTFHPGTTKTWTLVYTIPEGE